jgi:hypothetical protein
MKNAPDRKKRGTALDALFSEKRAQMGRRRGRGRAGGSDGRRFALRSSQARRVGTRLTTFIARYGQKPLEGFWFYRKMSDGKDRVHAYCQEYDLFLRQAVDPVT